VALILTLTAGLVFAACQPNDPAGGDLVTLRVLTWAGDREVTTEQQIADLYAERTPGVRIIVESASTNYQEKLLTSIAAGRPPDVFLLDGPDIPTFLDRGLTLDLSPYVRRLGYEPGRVFPEVLETFERGGGLYALPKDFTPMVVYANRRVFERWGVSLPETAGGWTRDDFLATARALTRDTTGDGRIDLYAFDFPRAPYQWIPWVWAGGGDILDPSGERASGWLDAPATLETLAFLTSLVREHGVTPGVQFVQSGDPAREARFATGGQALLYSGHWTLQLLTTGMGMALADLAILPTPHRGGTEPVTVLYASGWAVPANVMSPRPALELAAFLASEEAQRIRASTGLAIPAFQDVAAELAATDTTGVEAAFLREAARGRVTWGARIRDFHEIEELVFRVMDRHLLRGEPLAEAAGDVARAVDRVLER
jgi:multiple sugar transport system substrate-binding protein